MATSAALCGGRPPTALLLRPRPLLLVLVPSPTPAAVARRAAVAARAKRRSGGGQQQQKPRQRKPKAERSRPSADDVAAFLGEVEDELLMDEEDEDYDDEGEDDNGATVSLPPQRARRGRPMLKAAPPPSDFDKEALAAVDKCDPAALLDAERRSTYRVFADEEQDRAWQEQQRRIAQRERRQRLAAVAAAAAAAAESGGTGATPDPAALAKAAGLPVPPDPDSLAGRLLRVGEQNARPARLWNPRTGFARTAEEVEQEEREAAAALAAVEGKGPTTLERLGAERRRIWEEQDRRQRRKGGGGGGAAEEEGAASAASSSSSGALQSAPASQQLTPLPTVPRGQVLASAAATGAAMTAAALLLRLFAASGVAAPLTGGDQAAVDALVANWAPFPPLLPTPAAATGAAAASSSVQYSLGLATGTAAAVTGARLALCAALPASFGRQTALSNAQVLSPLSWPADDAFVALLSAVPEELLFRGALIPATGHADAAGVAVAAAVFGVLHVGGGSKRGPEFGLWATGVGAAYGALMLATGSVWAPCAAHALANFASATAWRMGAVKAVQVVREEVEAVKDD
jgi:membrane protease YdiL (CAAX protease family)